jgi:hypothetical protein
MKITLTPIQGKRGVFTASLAGKPAVIAWRARDRQKKEALSASVTFSADQVKSARALAHEQKVPCLVAVSVSLKGQLAHSYAVPVGTFEQIRVADADFPLGEKYRQQFAGDTNVLKGFQVEVAEPKKPAKKGK